MFFIETHKRSLIKAVIYRISAVLSAATVAGIISGSFISALNVGAFVLVVGFLMYYVHERLWTYIKLRRDMSTSDEYKSRSFIKTIVYRCIVLGLAVLTGKLLVGDTMDAIYFAVFSNAANAICYYVVERIFDRNKFGIKFI